MIPNDGSGAGPYRTSGPFLLFALTALVVGLVLSAAGKRLFRVTCALACGLAMFFAAWVVTINVQGPSRGLGNYRETTQGYIIYGISIAFGVMGAAFGATSWGWYAGMGAAGAEAGLVLASEILLMCRNDLQTVARYIILGVAVFVGLVFVPPMQARFGYSLATSLIGAFLIFLFVDLLSNERSGWSLGLRYLLDANKGTVRDRQSYNPPVSSRVFIALAWLFTVLFTFVQEWLWREPFVPETVEFPSICGGRRRGKKERHRSTSSTYPLGKGLPGLDEDIERPSPVYGNGDLESGPPSGRSSRLKKRYAEALGTTPPSPLMPLPEMTQRVATHPDEPPTPPDTILDSAFASGLASRPPTFFDAPLSEKTPSAVPTPHEINAVHKDIVWNEGRDEQSQEALAHEFAATVSRSTTGSSRDSGSNGSRKSWRKPVPPIEVVDLGTSEEGGDVPASAVTVTDENAPTVYIPVTPTGALIGDATAPATVTPVPQDLSVPVSDSEGTRESFESAAEQSQVTRSDLGRIEEEAEDEDKTEKPGLLQRLKMRRSKLP